MSDFRFIHTSDLHLGKGFGSMPQDLRGRLIEARHEVIASLAKAAREHGASHILVAGDTFDTTGPSAGVRRQAATAMSAATDIGWWIIPGNHDSLRGEELWQLFKADCATNVHVLETPEPVVVTEGVHLLPAPLPRQFPGIDLTAWMTEAETPEGQFRIGLAHGGVVSFGQDSDDSAMIPPDRAALANLDYLALGDWHGRLKVGERTHYSGTPERDRFKHDGRGVCLAVTLSAPGASPQVHEVEVGRFDWRISAINLSPRTDVADAFARAMAADRASRRDILMQLHANGFLRMSERGALEQLVGHASPDFAFFEMRDADLTTEYEADDLDLIAKGGALRAAADELHREAEGLDAGPDDMKVAQAALNRLWTLVREDEA